MKEYKTNEDLIEYLSSKGVTISDKSEALQKMERYTYYSIVNTYKSIFKDEDSNYFNNVTFDEIYASIFIPTFHHLLLQLNIIILLTYKL